MRFRKKIDVGIKSDIPTMALDRGRPWLGYVGHEEPETTRSDSEAKRMRA